MMDVNSTSIDSYEPVRNVGCDYITKGEYFLHTWKLNVGGTTKPVIFIQQNGIIIHI